MLNRGKGSSRWGVLSASVRSLQGGASHGARRPGEEGRSVEEVCTLLQGLIDENKKLLPGDERALKMLGASIEERFKRSSAGGTQATTNAVPNVAKRRPGRRMVSHASSDVEEHGFDLDAVSTGMPEERGGTAESKRTDSSTRRGNTLRFAASPNAALQKTRKKVTATASQERSGGGSSGIVSIDVEGNDGAGGAGTEAVEVVMGSSRLDGDLPQTSIPIHTTSMWLENPALTAGSRASASSFGSHDRLSEALSDADTVGGVGGGREWNLSTEARASGGAGAKTADTVPVVTAAYGSVAHGTRSVDLL